MAFKTDTSLITRNPLAMLRQMASDIDRLFEWPVSPRLTSGTGAGAPSAWLPAIDVLEKENQLVTRIDLPGLKKEDIKVEVTDGRLAISGERKNEVEEKTDNYYRCEREYGSFSRIVPLPDGVKLQDVKATFADGVLEVAVPLPVKAEHKVRKVQIEETSAAKPAA